jgi:hypothetical protein
MTSNELTFFLSELHSRYYDEYKKIYAYNDSTPDCYNQYCFNFFNFKIEIKSEISYVTFDLDNQMGFVHEDFFDIEISIYDLVNNKELKGETHPKKALQFIYDNTSNYKPHFR